MANHRAAVLVLLGTLAPVALPIPAAAQDPDVSYEAGAPVALAPPRRFVNYYLFPLGPIFYQCCTEREPVLADPTLAAPAAAGEERSANHDYGNRVELQPDTHARVARARVGCRHDPGKGGTRAVQGIDGDFHGADRQAHQH